MSKRRSRMGGRRQRGDGFEPTEELDFEPEPFANLDEDDDALELADYEDFEDEHSFPLPNHRPRQRSSSWRDYDYEDDWN